MFKGIGLILASFFVLSTVYCTAVFGLGSGGYRNEVVDAEAAGKGYSFTAQANGPSAVHYNPAGLTQLKGSFIATGYVMEAPRTEVDSVGTGNTVQMQKQIFWIPHVYFVSDFKSENLRFGFGANSPYGLSTDWADDGFARFLSTESDVNMLNFNPAVAYKINDNVSVGGGLDFFTARISKHRRVFTTYSSTNGDFQLKGDDEAFGYNLGLLIKPSEKQQIGLSYRSEIDLTYKGIVSLNGLDGFLSAAIFGAGVTEYSTVMESKSTIPRSIALGYAYQPNKKWTIETDIEWTDWSCVEEEFIKYPNETNALKLALLNAGNPASRDWGDGWAYAVGAEYKATDKLALRGGLLYESSPIPSVTWEPVLPDANKYGVTTGFGYFLKNNMKIDMSYSFIQYRERDITNDAGVVTSATINADGKYKGYVNLVGLTFTYKY